MNFFDAQLLTTLIKVYKPTRKKKGQMSDRNKVRISRKHITFHVKFKAPAHTVDKISFSFSFCKITLIKYFLTNNESMKKRGLNTIALFKLVIWYECSKEVRTSFCALSLKVTTS